MAGGLAPDQLHGATRALELGGEEAEQSFISGGIDWGRGDSDAQLCAEGLTDLVATGPGLQLDAQVNAFGMRMQKWRNGVQKGTR